MKVFPGFKFVNESTSKAGIVASKYRSDDWSIRVLVTDDIGGTVGMQVSVSRRDCLGSPSKEHERLVVAAFLRSDGAPIYRAKLSPEVTHFWQPDAADPSLEEKIAQMTAIGYAPLRRVETVS